MVIVSDGATGNDGNGFGTGHVRTYEYNGSDWGQLGNDIDGDMPFDRSGVSVSLSSDGSRLAIGATGNDNNGISSGHVRIYGYNDDDWIQLGGDIDGERTLDESGVSVSLSSDGNRLAIGATGNDDNGINSGHIRIYGYNDNDWIQLGGDIDGERSGDASGHSVSLSADGGRVAIVAPLNDDGGFNAGQTRIYNLEFAEAPLEISGPSITFVAPDDLDIETGVQTNLSGGLPIGGIYTGLGVIDDGNGMTYNFDPVISGFGLKTITYSYTDENGCTGSASDNVEVTFVPSFISPDLFCLSAGIQDDLSGGTPASGIYTGVGVIDNDDGNTYTFDPTAEGVVTGDNTIYYTILNQLGPDIDGETVGGNSGNTVSLSSNGSRVAIGARFNDGHGESAGHVRLYDYNAAVVQWEQIGGDIDAEAKFDQSGWSVSLSPEGNRVAIGAHFNDGNGSNSGHVRLYDYNPTVMRWEQVGNDIDGAAERDLSGGSISLSSDGSRVAIGARLNDSSGENAGHVRLYDYNITTMQWEQVGADINGEATFDEFGHSVSLSSNGNRVAIGARFNDGNGESAGHVRLYDYNVVNMQWEQVGTDLDGEADFDEFGYSVSLSSDGSRVAIGAIGNDGNGSRSGHVRLYDYNTITTQWEQVGADINGEGSGDESGYSVSLSSDGSRVAIGAPLNDGNRRNAGHVRFYDYNAIMLQWEQVGTDINGEGSGDESGYSVSLSSDGSRVAIGTPFE